MKRTVIFGIMLIIGINLNAQTYNPLKAAEYASYWCDKRNVVESPDYVPNSKWGGPYKNYGSTGPGALNLGGDCANFVSQCLIYGGLNLSAGTNGNGNGVKPEGTITGVQNLVTHLTKHQNTTVETVYGYNPSINHDVGDPMFEMGQTASAYHSQICSSLDSDADRLYSMHSNDHCDVYTKAWYDDRDRNIFFHIKSAYPDHCYDCEQNFGETGKDCGGPCPPCEHAPKRKNINTPTSNLPSEVRAIENITAGNAAVKVLNGQNVTFITAGSIDLLPGFEVEAGADFSTQFKKLILQATADCDAFCRPTFWIYFIRGTFYFIEVANAKKIVVEIWTNSTYHREPIYTNTVDVTQEGIVDLWDLVTVNVPGANHHSSFLKPDGRVHPYVAYIWVYPCQGGVVPFVNLFGVFNPKGRSDTDSEFDETGSMDALLLSNSDDIMLPNESTTPTFSILPNPNPGTFQLEANFPLTHIAHLKITNLLGATVYESQKVTSNTIQLPNAATGTHFVVVMLKDGNVLTQKMVVQ